MLSVSQRIKKELEQWSALEHDKNNLIPFIGYCEGVRGPLLGLVSKWMPDGRILQYLENHPDTDRLSLVRYLQQSRILVNNLVSPQTQYTRSS